MCTHKGSFGILSKKNGKYYNPRFQRNALQRAYTGCYFVSKQRHGPYLVSGCFQGAANEYSCAFRLFYLCSTIVAPLLCITGAFYNFRSARRGVVAQPRTPLA